MEKSYGKERLTSSEEIHKTLDCFGSKSRSPVEDDEDDQFGLSPERLSFIDDPLGRQRLSFISADGSEFDSDYSSASSVLHAGSEEQRNLEIEWQALFGSTTYYTTIRQYGLDGKLRSSKFRSICWKVFLECLPEQKEDWVSRTTKLRNDYTQFKSKCLFDPNKGKNDQADLAVFNPLSQDETSPWKQYFLDSELKSTIKQDLDRLFPEIDFFQQSKVKEMMLNILFCHAKKNEALSYKQGMHELLAPIVYVLHKDTSICQYLEGSSLKVAKFLMDSNFLEHDAFALFVQLMDQTETWYLQVPVAGRCERNKFLDPHAEPFADQELMPSTAIVKKLNRIQEHMLRKYDPELWVHMKNLDITPQVYGLRWIRLLFGREFPMDDVLVLWDALFADGPMLDLVDFIYISMLEAIRDKLLAGSYSACMSYLMKFPGGFTDVYRYVKTALIMRENKSSSSRSSPRMPRSPKHHPPYASGTYPRHKKPEPKRAQSAFTSFTKRYQQFIDPVKQTVVKPVAKSQAIPAPPVGKQAEELLPRRPRPARPVSVPVPEMRDRADSGSQTSPGKGVKSIKDKLMTRPRNRSRIDYDELAQDHERLQKQVSSLKSELDKMQGLYLYCGRKMDSYIDLLQDELTKEEDSVRDIVYLCLAGLKQVRDLLKGTLAFRGSTMETECDFMEIDNNIASRLQVPSLHKQKESDISDTLPVPMLANFGHFESEGDEKESSFMAGNIDGKQNGETAGSSEPSSEGDLENGEGAIAGTQRNEEQAVVDSESNGGKLVVDLENTGSDILVEGGDNAVHGEESVVQGQHDIQSGGSNSSFCGDSVVTSAEETRSNGNSVNSNESCLSGIDPRTDNETNKPEEQCGENNVLKNRDAIDCPNGSESLDDTKLFEETPRPPSDSGNDVTGTTRTESPDREFVFVDRDGTAQAPPSHPLERSDEYF